jgi:tyrosyl-tRNA synthetase
MDRVAAVIKASPTLVELNLERDIAVAKANEAKAKLAKAVTTAKLSDDVEKSAKKATEAAVKAEAAASGAIPPAKMALCLKSLEKTANQADALKILKTCLDKVP